MMKLFAHKSVLFDFDGVIKESVEVKGQAFQKLFEKFGFETVSRVRDHHAAHPGVSRFEKIPLYLRYAGAEVSEKTIKKYCNRFATIVKSQVVSSAWVPGIESFLHQQAINSNLFLISATPEEEMKEIAIELGIDDVFEQIFGSPTSKVEAINYINSRYGFEKKEMVFIGDSKVDHDSALSCGIEFVLRLTDLNTELGHLFQGKKVVNFL